MCGPLWAARARHIVKVGALLKAPPEDLLDCYPVSREVNSVRFDKPEYAEKVNLDCASLLGQNS